MSSPQATRTELEAAAAAIRDHSRFLLTTHENPDGDALGSLLAADLALRDLGKDTVMYLCGQVPLPAEYGFMALDIALVTDTGRFQYTNTTPRALRLAAELVEAGANLHRVFQGVYESVEFAKLKLLARALERAEVYDGGRLVISYLLRDDFLEVGAVEPYSEGIIDYLRAVE